MSRNAANSTTSQLLLDELQVTIDREIPMCGQMGIRVESCEDDALAMSAPLEPNRNHQQTAFAGSLNALCTVTGWGSVWLLLRESERQGNIVIRRSAIKYLQPAQTARILARSLPIGQLERTHFVEMLAEKGQSKIDVHVHVGERGSPAVSFHGSYVVLGTPARRDA